MLTHEQNAMITQTNAGTPMGELMRRHWVPALLTEEIPTPDSPPVQVRILGEELVAFRDSQGRIGLLEEHCPHRGTSLFYGRSEESGLRCIYHGWKMDVEGKVLETPAEPASSTFGQRVRQIAYPTHEVGGMIWAYLGPGDPPLFPRYDWVGLPADHFYVTKCLQECNYLQGLEGECDSSHLSFLHRILDPKAQPLYADPSPVYQMEDTDFGVRLIALRKFEDQIYLRVSSFVMPVGSAVPVGGRGVDLDGYEVHFYTPYDDTHSWRFDFGFRRSRAIVPEDVNRRAVIDQNYRRIPNQSNHYLQDREKQRTYNFTGIDNFLSHDSCATESMGALYDRSREHLGVSDKGVIAVRRYLLDAARALQEEGREPPSVVRDPALNDFRHAESLAKLVPTSDWHPLFPHLVDSSQELLALASRQAPVG
jgi:phthalate 4,5-dioxygenase